MKILWLIVAVCCVCAPARPQGGIGLPFVALSRGGNGLRTVFGLPGNLLSRSLPQQVLADRFAWCGTTGIGIAGSRAAVIDDQGHRIAVSERVETALPVCVAGRPGYYSGILHIWNGSGWEEQAMLTEDAVISASGAGVLEWAGEGAWLSAAEGRRFLPGVQRNALLRDDGNVLFGTGDALAMLSRTGSEVRTPLARAEEYTLEPAGRSWVSAVGPKRLLIHVHNDRLEVFEVAEVEQ